MKCGCLFSGLFWGVLLILLGVLVIIKIIFNIELPIFKILLSVFLIYLGVKIFFGSVCSTSSRSSAVFKESKVNAEMIDDEYSVVFGKSHVDLTDIELVDKNITKKVSVVFGEASIKINNNIPVIVRSSAVFGEVKLPDGNSVSFGNTRYKSPSYNADDPALIVIVDVVFGGASVVKVNISE